jgi:DNA-binding LacI/PurR family transcriptional regulator
MSVTQKQIAERLNISGSLVGRALRGHQEVAESTRLLIEQTAREMGYDLYANREARALIARRYGQRLKNGVAAVVFCPAPGVSIRSLPYSEPILEGMEAEAAKLNLDICFCPARDDEIPRLVRDRSVDGVIVLGYFPEYIAAIRELGLPVVTFQSKYDIAHSIISDDRNGTRQATRHLLELGHRRIAFLGVEYRPGQAGHQRLLGYRDAMTEYGIEVRDEWVCTSLTGPRATPTATCIGCGVCAACIGWTTLAEQNGGYGKEGELPFTGVVCYNDPIAMASIAQLQAAGYEVPHDISFTGFDDTSLSYHFQPALTSVDYEREEMGRDSIRLLNQAIHEVDKDEVSEPAVGGPMEYWHHVIPTRLAQRQSTGPVPLHTVRGVHQLAGSGREIAG